MRLNEVEELLIRAESAVAVGNAAVNLALGRDPGTPFSLPGVLDIDVADEKPPLEQLIDEAKTNRFRISPKIRFLLYFGMNTSRLSASPAEPGGLPLTLVERSRPPGLLPGLTLGWILV